MPLYNEEWDTLPTSYYLHYWTDFHKYEGSDLHNWFVKYLIDYLPRKPIWSSMFCKRAMQKLEKNNPTLKLSYRGESLGSLFGCMLWNYLSEGKDVWFVRRKEKDKRGKYYYTESDK